MLYCVCAWACAHSVGGSLSRPLRLLHPTSMDPHYTFNTVLITDWKTSRVTCLCEPTVSPILGVRSTELRAYSFDSLTSTCLCYMQKGRLYLASGCVRMSCFLGMCTFIWIYKGIDSSPRIALCFASFHQVLQLLNRQEYFFFLFNSGFI